MAAVYAISKPLPQRRITSSSIAAVKALKGASIAKRVPFLATGGVAASELGDGLISNQSLNRTFLPAGVYAMIGLGATAKTTVNSMRWAALRQ